MARTSFRACFSHTHQAHVGLYRCSLKLAFQSTPLYVVEIITFHFKTCMQEIHKPRLVREDPSGAAFGRATVLVLALVRVLVLDFVLVLAVFTNFMQALSVKVRTKLLAHLCMWS